MGLQRQHQPGRKFVHWPRVLAATRRARHVTAAGRCHWKVHVRNMFNTGMQKLLSRGPRCGLQLASVKISSSKSAPTNVISLSQLKGLH